MQSNNMLKAVSSAKVYVSQKDFIVGSVSPVEAGKLAKFIGQLYINKTDSTMWYATDLSSVNGWRQVTPDTVIEWTDIVGKPDSVEGYGIKDVYTKEYIDYMYNEILSGKVLALKDHTHETLKVAEIENILDDIFPEN